MGVAAIFFLPSGDFPSHYPHIYKTSRPAKKCLTAPFIQKQRIDGPARSPDIWVDYKHQTNETWLKWSTEIEENEFDDPEYQCYMPSFVEIYPLVEGNRNPNDKYVLYYQKELFKP